MLRPASNQGPCTDSPQPRQPQLRRQFGFRLWSRRTTVVLTLAALVLCSLVSSVSRHHRLLSVDDAVRTLALQQTRFPQHVLSTSPRVHSTEINISNARSMQSRADHSLSLTDRSGPSTDRDDDQLMQDVADNYTNTDTGGPGVHGLPTFNRHNSRLPSLSGVPERWPSGMEMRRKRRYSHIPDGVAEPPLLLNSLDCPSHRTRSPYGFLPATGKPIDSTIIVQSGASPTRSARCSDVGIVKAMMSRQDIDSSPYFTFVPLPDSETLNPNITQPRKTQRAAECGNTRSRQLQVDLVYTYVNGSAPSLQQALSQVGLPYDPHRYRDWDELRYSLRSVYYRAICSPGGGADRVHNTNGKHTCVEGAFIRRIFIVVADQDQVPLWLNTSHPLLRVVTHRDIFPSIPDPRRSGRRLYPHLPTFNSHAIELQLHRIPGLSRFYIYFNNDMILGRRLSLLDYFRPLSDVRREARRLSFGKTVGGCTSSDTEDTCAVLEPIVYGEAMSRGCTPRRRKGAASQLLQALLHDKEKPGSSTCSHHFIRPSFLYDLECFYPTRRSYDAEPMLRKMNFNQRLAFDRLDGLSVVHSFPHFPQLFDRLLVERMVETDFADVAESTRLHRRRTDKDLFITMLYGTYALAHRMSVETVLNGNEQLGDGVWSPRAWAEWAAAAPPLALNVPFDDATIHQHLNSLGRNFFTTDTWMPTSWQFALSSSSASTKSAIRNLTGVFDASWMSSDALLACSKRRNCTSVLKEKCLRHVVFFFDKLSSYRFCQLIDKRDARQCLKDVFASSSGTGSRLFWTLNDDWGLPRPGAKRRNMNRTVPTTLRWRNGTRNPSRGSDHDGVTGRRSSTARRMFWSQSEAQINPMTRPTVRRHRRAQQFNDNSGANKHPLSFGGAAVKPPDSSTTSEDTAKIMRRLLQVITRGVGAAPWELQRQDDREESREPLEQGDDERYGPRTLVDYRSRRDILSFLRREWITDKKRPKDEWLHNLLD